MCKSAPYVYVEGRESKINDGDIKIYGERLETERDREREEWKGEKSEWERRTGGCRESIEKGERDWEIKSKREGGMDEKWK